MEMLLALLRGLPVEHSTTEGDWFAVFELAEEHHLAAFIAPRIRAAGVSLPRGIELRLAGIEREAILSSFFWSAELRGLLHTFRKAELAVMPLKGPFLAQRLYGGESLRTSRDLDLLVRKPEAAAAENLLLSLGFQPMGPGDDYHRPWLRETTGVELHFDVENPLAFDFGVEGAWRRAGQASFAGEACWLMTPEDEILFLVLHGMRHCFDKLTLVLDLALAMERCAASAPVDLVRNQRSSRLDSALELGAELASRLRPATLRLRLRPSEHIRRLSERIWTRLMGAPPVVLDWQARHRFYRELECTRLARMGTRLRHGRILLGRVIEPDYAFAAKLGLTRRWQASLLRPLRLVGVRARRVLADI